MMLLLWFVLCLVLALAAGYAWKRWQNKPTDSGETVIEPKGGGGPANPPPPR